MEFLQVRTSKAVVHVRVIYKSRGEKEYLVFKNLQIFKDK